MRGGAKVAGCRGRLGPLREFVGSRHGGNGKPGLQGRLALGPKLLRQILHLVRRRLLRFLGHLVAGLSFALLRLCRLGIGLGPGMPRFGFKAKTQDQDECGCRRDAEKN